MHSIALGEDLVLHLTVRNAAVTLCLAPGGLKDPVSYA